MPHEVVLRIELSCAPCLPISSKLKAVNRVDIPRAISAAVLKILGAILRAIWDHLSEEPNFRGVRKTWPLHSLPFCPILTTITGLSVAPLSFRPALTTILCMFSTRFWCYPERFEKRAVVRSYNSERSFTPKMPQFLQCLLVGENLRRAKHQRKKELIFPAKIDVIHKGNRVRVKRVRGKGKREAISLLEYESEHGDSHMKTLWRSIETGTLPYLCVDDNFKGTALSAIVFPLHFIRNGSPNVLHADASL